MLTAYTLRVLLWGVVLTVYTLRVLLWGGVFTAYTFRFLLWGGVLTAYTFRFLLWGVVLTAYTLREIILWGVMLTAYTLRVLMWGGVLTAYTLRVPLWGVVGNSFNCLHLQPCACILWLCWWVCMTILWLCWWVCMTRIYKQALYQHIVRSWSWTGLPEPYIYGADTVFLAGKSLNIRSYTAYIYGSANPNHAQPFKTSDTTLWDNRLNPYPLRYQLSTLWDIMNNPLRHQVRSPVASYVQPPHRVQHPSEMYCTLVCRVQDVVYTILAIYTCVVYIAL